MRKPTTKTSKVYAIGIKVVSNVYVFSVFVICSRIPRYCITLKHHVYSVCLPTAFTHCLYPLPLPTAFTHCLYPVQSPPNISKNINRKHKRKTWHVCRVRSTRGVWGRHYHGNTWVVRVTPKGSRSTTHFTPGGDASLNRHRRRRSYAHCLSFHHRMWFWDVHLEPHRPLPLRDTPQQVRSHLEVCIRLR